MTLRRQIASGFAVVAVPVVVVTLIALSVIGRLGSAVDAVLLENDRSLEAASEMDGALERIDSAALLALLDRDAEADRVATEARPRFRRALDAASGNLTIRGEDRIIGDVEEAFEEVQRAYLRLAQLAPGEARDEYATAFVPAFDRTRVGLTRLRTLNREAAREAGQGAQTTARTATWTVAIGALLALALIAWAAAKLSREIAAQPGSASP